MITIASPRGNFLKFGQAAGSFSTQTVTRDEAIADVPPQPVKSVSMSGQLAALAALEADHDNLRAVLNQSVRSHFGESGALV